MQRLLPVLLVAVAACAYDWSLGWRDAGPGPGPDASKDSSADAQLCNLLLVQALADLLADRGCSDAGPSCSEAVYDQCGCEVSLSIKNNVDTQLYEHALEEFKMAGCKPACGGCIPITYTCLDGKCN